MPGAGCDPVGYEFVVLDAGCVSVDRNPVCQTAMLDAVSRTCSPGPTCEPRPGPGVCVAGLCDIGGVGYIKQAIPYAVGDVPPGSVALLVWGP